MSNSKKMKKILRTLIVSLVVAILFLQTALPVFAEVYGGQCGQYGSSIQWTLDTDTGVLELNGNGWMLDYSTVRVSGKPLLYTNAPWNQYGKNEEYIKTINISVGNNWVSNSAFAGCTKLQSVSLPEGLITIGKDAFRCCISLASVMIPDSVTEIRELAFNYCPSLTEIIIPSTVTEIGSYSLGYSDYELVEGFTIYGYSGSAAETYAKNNGITFVSLGLSPDAYVDIQPGETKSTGELYSDDIAYFRFIPEEDMIVSFCSKGADYDTQGYVFDSELNELIHKEREEGFNFKITYPLISGKTYYFGAAWYVTGGYHSGSFNVTLKKLTEWEYSIKEDGTAEITKYNGNAAHIKIPESIDGYTVTSIGYSAFSDHVDLTSIDIPDTVTEIGDSAFKGCIGLTSVTFPEILTEIDYCAFENCTGLTEIFIPSSVTRIAYNAFSGCSGLSSIKIDEDNTVYDSRDDCNAIIITEDNYLLFGCKNTVITDTVTNIGMEAFRDCTELNSITIPDSVTIIGSNAFSNTGLTSIIIPDSVTSIGYYAFGYDLEGKIPDFTIYGYSGSAAETYAKNNGFTFIPLDDIGFTVSGGFTSYLDPAGTVTVQLLQGDTVKYSTTATGNTGSYSIPNVANGSYTLRVSKANHVTRDYEITVSGDATQDVKIHPLGDISGDGKTTTRDFAMAYAHAQHSKGAELTGYALKCGDVIRNDGKVKTADAARINAHAQKTDLLYS